MLLTAFGESWQMCRPRSHCILLCRSYHNVPIIIHCSFHRELHPQHVGRVERLQRNLHRAPPGAPKCVRVRWFTRYIQRLGYSGSYNAEGATTLRQAKNIKLHPPCQPKHMPKQERMKTIIKRERFGGTCDILQMAKQSVKNADVLVSCSSVGQGSHP